MIKYEWGCGKKYQYIMLSPSEIASLEATGYFGCFTLEGIANEVNKHMGGCEFSEDGTWPHDFKRVAEEFPHLVIFQCVHDARSKGLDLDTYFVKDEVESAKG